jgi:nucleoside-triphosphatase THEP1
MPDLEQNERTLIVELNGLPGSGKTTVIDLLFERLQKTGICVAKRKGIYQPQKSKFRRLFRLIQYGGIRLPLFLSIFFLSIKPFRTSRYKYFNKLIYYYLMYMQCIEEGKYDIILVDEGIIQYINATIHPDSLKNTAIIKKIINTLNDEGMNYFVVDCLSDEVISCERILERKRNTSRFDKMKDNILKQHLKTFNLNFLFIRPILNDCQWINRVKLDMSQTPEQNCNLLFDEIIRKKKCYLRRDKSPIPGMNATND